MNGTDSMAATPDAIDSEVERRSAFTANLRALADLLDTFDGLTLPSLDVCCLDVAQLDAWKAALTTAGHPVTDATDEHACRVESGGLRVVYVLPESMRAYVMGQRVLAAHQDEVDALLASTAEPVEAVA